MICWIGDFIKYKRPQKNNMSFNWKKMYQQSFAEKKALKEENEKLKFQNKKLSEHIMKLAFDEETDEEEELEKWSD